MARIKEYWLQLESRSWDTAPWGANRQTGRPMPRVAGGMFRPATREMYPAPHDGQLGRARRPAAQPLYLTEPDPATTHGTIPGPTLTAKVADEIVVHFRNMDTRPGIHESDRVHSLHPHGAGVSAAHNGVFPLAPPDPAQGHRRGDRVPPGDSFIYRWTLPHKSAAGVWLYHDAAADGGQSTGPRRVRCTWLPRPPASRNRTRRRGSAAPPRRHEPRRRCAPAARRDASAGLPRTARRGAVLNGRAGLGNTPALVVGEWYTHDRALPQRLDPAGDGHHPGPPLGARPSLYQHRTLPPGMGATLDILSGSAEGGGGPGEWLITGRAGNLLVRASFITTAGGALELQSA